MVTSLVLPTWNGGKLLEEVLAAVDAQPGATDLERVAVDSGSTDGTVQRLEAHGFRVIGIDQRRFNHGSARDLAIEATTGDVVLLLTQDATPQPGWLAALRGAYDDPAVDAAWCHQQARPGANPLLRRRIAEWMGDRAALTVQRLADGQRLADLAPLDQLRLCALDNVASSVRRSTWARYRFGWRRFGEDVAFGKRVIEGGGAIAFVPEARVVHSHDTTPEQEGRRIYCDHANLRELFGVRTIPTIAACRRAIRGGRRHFAALVAAEPDLSPEDRERLHRWAMDYVSWASWGQYLGGNSRELRRSEMAPLLRAMDRAFRKGI